MNRGTNHQIPFIDLAAQRARLAEDIDGAIARIMEHGTFIQGPEVAELEQALSQRGNARVAVGCSSGTDALVLCLMAAGVGPGDAVFVPAFTFFATAEAVALVGATPVFVDVETERFSIDATRLRQAVDGIVTDAQLRPAAVIPVDLFGQPADYPAIEKALEGSDIIVIADAAQSFGATLNGIPVGALAPLTATSFYPAKPLGCYGDGGAILATDTEQKAVLASLREHGQGNTRYRNDRVGLNARLDTIQAAVLLEKLGIFDEELSTRQRIADRYNEQLADVCSVPSLAKGATSSWACYTIRTPERDRLREALAVDGIPTAIYYPIPLHAQEPFSVCRRFPDAMTVSNDLAAQVLSLPIHPYLSEEDQDRICAAIRAELG